MPFKEDALQGVPSKEMPSKEDALQGVSSQEVPSLTVTFLLTL